MRRFCLWMQGDIQTAAFRRHGGPICASLSRESFRVLPRTGAGHVNTFIVRLGVIFPLVMWRHRRLELPPTPIQFSVVRFPHLGAQQNTARTVLFLVPFVDITSKSDITKLEKCESMVWWKKMRTGCCVAKETSETCYTGWLNSVPAWNCITFSSTQQQQNT
jgi:hypothetical protein